MKYLPIILIFITSCVNTHQESVEFKPFEGPAETVQKPVYDVSIEDVLTQRAKFERDLAPEGEVLRVVYRDGTSKGISFEEQILDIKLENPEMLMRLPTEGDTWELVLVYPNLLTQELVLSIME